MFYTLAAEAHPGQDGSRRKGTLHYEIPQNQYSQSSQYPIDQQFPHSHAQIPQYQPGPMFTTQPLGPSYAPPVAHSQSQPMYAPMGFNPTLVNQGQDYMTTPNPHDCPHQQYVFGQPAVPVPAQFANAGPPAYQYQPMGYEAQQWSSIPQNYPFAPSYTQASSNTMAYPIGWTGQSTQHPHHHQHQAPQGRPMMQSRSEWSSPMPNHGLF